MSQVVSIRVLSHFDEACAAFRKESDIADTIGKHYSDCKDFMVFYDTAAREIRCEGILPDSAFSALQKTKEQFGGTLFYEGEEWKEDHAEEPEEANTSGKIWIVLMVVFFPITLIYILFRTVFWVPYRIWKETR